jgi:hypothetical protein
MLNKNRVGLIIGTFSGVWHVLWSVLVATSQAQPLLDWVYKLHSLNNPFHVAAFSVTTSIGLVLFSFFSGYVIGWFLAFLWNSIHKSAEQRSPSRAIGGDVANRILPSNPQ